MVPPEAYAMAQRNLLLVKGAHLSAVEHDGTDHVSVLQQRHAE
jgi:hypothetical protein